MWCKHYYFSIILPVGFVIGAVHSIGKQRRRESQTGKMCDPPHPVMWGGKQITDEDHTDAVDGNWAGSAEPGTEHGVVRV